MARMSARVEVSVKDVDARAATAELDDYITAWRKRWESGYSIDGYHEVSVQRANR